jgi:Ca-activated chloride channel homolog
MHMILSDDPKLTAYALGELQGQERAAIEAALHDDPAARAAVEQIRALAAQLSGALAQEAASEPSEVLGQATQSVEDPPIHSARAAIISGRDPTKLDGGPLFDYGRRSKIFSFPQLYFFIGAAAAACVALIISLAGGKPRVVTQYKVIHLAPSAAMPAQLPKATPGADEVPGVESASVPAERAITLASTGALEAGVSSRQLVATPVTPEVFAAESHAFHRDNPFVVATNARWSTFGVDVDTTSYAAVRRSISAGLLPSAGDVRIEELLNYFPTTLNASLTSKPTEPVTASLEVAEAPWAPSHRLVRIGLVGRDTVVASRPRANLVFLIDVSGSMDAPNKLPLIQQSMRLLIDRLQPDDRVAIVTYAGTSGVVLPSTPVANARDILAALDTLTPAGSTNGAMGLDLAYDIAKSNRIEDGINRVVLCTDGDFNVGPTREGALARLVEDKANTGVALTALGFGMERTKDSTLEMLADKGHGTCGYINTRRDAEKLLAEQVGATLLAVARDVKVQVEFNPSRVESYRLIGYEDRLLQPQTFADSASPGAEMGAGQSVTAVYEVVPKPTRDAAVTSVAATDALLTFRVRFKEPAADEPRQLDFALKDAGETFAQASDDFKLAAAVAEYGMILRDSPHRGKASIGDVIAWASSTTRKTSGDARDYRGEFIDLARRTQALLQ